MKRCGKNPSFFKIENRDNWPAENVREIQESFKKTSGNLQIRDFATNPAFLIPVENLLVSPMLQQFNPIFF